MIESLDAIFCINLDRRTDRWETFCHNWSFLDVPIERFSAIDGDKIKTPESKYSTRDRWHNKYSRGCSLSHILVLERAIAYGYEEILIFEDDASPCSDFIEKFNKAYKQLPATYDFCYLGGASKHEGGCEGLRHIDENIAVASSLKTLTGYLIKLEFAKKIIPRLKKLMGRWAVDDMYALLQEEESMYIFDPRLVHQENSYSDILRRTVYYTHLKDLE